MTRERGGADERVRAAIRAARQPQEQDALERAVVLARSQLDARSPHPGRRSGRRLAAALAAAAAAAALVLTPAGADVRGWVADAIVDDGAVEQKSLTRLPVGGELLVNSRAGTWLVGEDGSRQMLGGYEESTFSPNGLYVAATRGDQLTALDPEGQVRWSITRPAALSDPRWAPSGFRIAFREGRSLSVVVGDATSPARKLVAGVAPTAPSWRPAPERADPTFEPHVLTYLHGSGSITTIDTDTGREIWRWSSVRPAREVVWAGPDRLVVSYAESVRILDRRGNPVGSVPLPRDARVGAVTPSPDGERLAVVLDQVDGISGADDAPSRLYLARISEGERRERTVFSGFGHFGAPSFSPGGEWILLPWKDTDQWLFINPSEDRKLLRRVVAVGDISRQFDPGGRGRSAAPTVAGWCCDD